MTIKKLSLAWVPPSTPNYSMYSSSLVFENAEFLKPDHRSSNKTQPPPSEIHL